MQRPSLPALVPLSFAILLGACAAPSSHVITGQPRTPIDPAEVKVYTAAPAKYEEIAMIDASSRSSGAFDSQKKMDAVIERLKKEAAALGANGVLLQGTGSDSGGGVSTGVGVSKGMSGGGVSIGTGIFTSSEVKTGKGLAIHVPPEVAQ